MNVIKDLEKFYNLVELPNNHNSFSQVLYTQMFRALESRIYDCFKRMFNSNAGLTNEETKLYREHLNEQILVMNNFSGSLKCDADVINVKDLVSALIDRSSMEFEFKLIVGRVMFAQGEVSEDMKTFRRIISFIVEHQYVSWFNQNFIHNCQHVYEEIYT
jgi:hypothetical protein